MKVSLDQHLMVDIRILEKIAKSAGIKKSDRILEIGAGTGNLKIGRASCRERV